MCTKEIGYFFNHQKNVIDINSHDDILGEGMNLVTPPAIGQLVQLHFYKDGFSIEWPKKFDMPLNKENKSNH